MAPFWIGDVMTGRLANKTAIVTGAGRGIGAAIARRFAKEGARVAIWEHDAETGAANASALNVEGGEALLVACDVTDQAMIDKALVQTTDSFGAVDILINNAGANVFHKPMEMPDAEWDRCMRLDLDAAWWCARAVLPGMLEQARGSIVNIASTHSFKIIPSTFPYPVAKHALIGLTRSLGIEYAANGIRVNAIAPGYIETQIALDYWATFDDPQAERQRACDLHPPGRIGQPEEVAMTAVFLASDEAPFINAETIMIDGGRSALYHQ